MNIRTLFSSSDQSNLVLLFVINSITLRLYNVPLKRWRLRQLRCQIRQLLYLRNKKLTIFSISTRILPFLHGMLFLALLLSIHLLHLLRRPIPFLLDTDTGRFLHFFSVFMLDIELASFLHIFFRMISSLNLLALACLESPP
jgi:hypothetical protein